MKVAVVIPAYNEEQRIGAVLDTVLKSPVVDEVIVVSDGSEDRTHEVARSYDGVRAVRLERNHGKGGALHTGARHTDADVLIFFDADLQGLKPEHVETLVKPVAGCSADMCIGVFRGGKWHTTLAQRVSPNISGQRAVKRRLFLEVPRVAEGGYGVEVRMNKYFRRKRYRIKRVELFDVTHPVKEAKIGKLRGTLSRMRMYAEILRVYFFEW